jgi:hypothetical protein
MKKLKNILVIFPLLFLLTIGGITAQNPQQDRSFGRKSVECIMGAQHNNFYVTNAVFYDDGGELGNVGSNYLVSSFIGDGEPLELFFTDFKLPNGAVLNIYRGSSLQGELLASFEGGQNQKPWNFKGRSFTIEYIPPTNGASAAGWRGEIHKLTGEYLWQKAMLPESDCINAIPICNNSTINTSANQYEDTGAINDDSGSCYGGTGSGGSVWYQFTPQASGPLDFSINPAGSTDYDFVLWDITNGCENRVQLSCNWAAPTGPTGISSTGDNTDSQGSDGTRFNRRVNVDVTRRYAICINYYSGTNAGFTLNFQNNTGSVAVVDNTPPTMTNVTANNCGNASTINVFFSEFIDCNTLNNGDFTIPGRTVSISTSNCTGTPGKTTQITLTITPALVGPGTYTLTGQDCNDLCGNPLNQTYNIILGSVPIPNAGPDRISCRSSSFFGSSYTTVPLNASGGTNYYWSNGQTGANINVTPISTSPVTYTVSVQDGSACVATDQVTVFVENVPTPNLGATQTVCTGFPVSLFSGVSPSGVTYQWQQTTSTNFFGQPTSFTNISGQTGQNLTITPAVSPTWYRVVITSPGGCQGTSTVRINQGSGAFGITASKDFLCQGENVTLSLPSSITSYNWSTGTNANQALTASPATTTTFSVTSTTAGCTGSASVTIPVRPVQTVTAAVTPTTVCAGEPVNLTGGPGPSANTIVENFEGATQSFTLVNGARNNWHHGTAAFANGSRGLYIGTASTNNNYEIGSAFGSRPATNFAYRDYPVTSFCNANLNFLWRCNGISNNAELTVWALPNTVVPSATAGNSLVAGAGTILLGGPYFGQGASYQNVNIDLTQFAGTTVRIVFQWRNVGQNILGTVPAPANPAAAIDDIIFTESTSYNYSWTASTGGFSAAGQNANAFPVTNTVYTLQTTRCDGCVAEATTTVNLCTILGLELSSFTALCSAANAIVKWSAENESGVESYMLQYSVDGVEFSDKVRLTAGVGSYESSIALQNGINHYFRLKQQHIDGSISYSAIIQESCTGIEMGEILLFPNPAGNNLNVSFNVPVKGNYRFSLIDILGRELETFEYYLIEEHKTLTIDTEKLSSAIYFIKIEELGQLISPKILKFVKE